MERCNFKIVSIIYQINESLRLQTGTSKHGQISLRLQNETLKNLIIARNTAESGIHNF